MIITGANAGVGKAAALQLAATGATVVLACRSAARGAEALADIKRITGNQNICMMQVDLSSQLSIRDFAAAFKNRFTRLDVLIHNAANFDLSLKSPVMTADGIETIFATNHVGPFLLTHLLLDVLKASAPSRIITVASKGLMMYPSLEIEFDNLMGERKFSPQHAYYHAKLAQVMFTYTLAQRLKGSGVTANCVRVTNVALPDDRLTHLSDFQRKIYQIKRNMAISPEKMAETYVYLATNPAVAEISGGYWDENNQQVKSSKKSYNWDAWQKLWRESERLAGIDDIAV